MKSECFGLTRRQCLTDINNIYMYTKYYLINKKRQSPTTNALSYLSN